MSSRPSTKVSIMRRTIHPRRCNRSASCRTGVLAGHLQSAKQHPIRNGGGEKVYNQRASPSLLDTSPSRFPSGGRARPACFPVDSIRCAVNIYSSPARRGARGARNPATLTRTAVTAMMRAGRLAVFSTEGALRPLRAIGRAFLARKRAVARFPRRTERPRSDYRRRIGRRSVVRRRRMTSASLAGYSYPDKKKLAKKKQEMARPRGQGRKGSRLRTGEWGASRAERSERIGPGTREDAMRKVEPSS